MKNFLLRLVFCTAILLQVSLAGGPLSGYVNAIAVSGSNVYAETWGDGIFTSSDNGGNWHAASNGFFLVPKLSLGTFC